MRRALAIVGICLGISGLSACKSQPEPAAAEAPDAVVATPDQAKDAEAELQRKLLADRRRREAELLDIIQSANMVAMPEVVRARIRAGSFAELAELRFEDGDTDAALDAVRNGKESVRFASDPRLTAALSRTEFLILHFSALDAAKRGDVDKSLKLFDAITLISGLSPEDRARASGDRLLVMESRQDGAQERQAVALDSALRRILGIETPATSAVASRAGEPATYTFDPEKIRRAVGAEIGREVSEAKLPTAQATAQVETGELDPAVVVRVVSANKAAITACYAQALRGGGGERGKLAILVTVQPSGEVSSAKITTGQFKTSPLGHCIAETVGRWRFPPFRGDPREIELPFVLDYLQ